MMRRDDPQGVMKFKDRYYGGTALIVLGGPSGKDWEQLRDEVNPSVILTANGNTDIGADFWMLAENMNHQYELAKRAKTERDRLRAEGFMCMLSNGNDAKVKLISYLSWNLLDLFGIDKSKCVCIKRIVDPNVYELPDTFSLREYGDGFLSGPMFSRKECVQPSIRLAVGTVAACLLHMAGILGCFEVHTIGMDFCFKGKQHWYEHPDWEADRFRTKEMFTNYNGLPTMWEWVEGAEWLQSLEWLFEIEGLEWRDHSNGLLQEMGVWCAI